MYQQTIENLPSPASSPQQKRRVRPWVVILILAPLAAVLIGAGYLAVLSYRAQDVAKTLELQLELEANAANTRLITVRESFNQQMEMYTRDDEALIADGYESAGKKGLYWRQGTLEVADPDAYCEKFESCAMGAFRTNSFVECPNGVSIEITGSAGDVMTGVTESLPKNGAVQIEIEWLGPTGPSASSKMECR